MASTSSGSSDTAMSPSSASPTQNTVAVECRWWWAAPSPPLSAFPASRCLCGDVYYTWWARASGQKHSTAPSSSPPPVPSATWPLPLPALCKVIPPLPPSTLSYQSWQQEVECELNVCGGGGRCCEFGSKIQPCRLHHIAVQGTLFSPPQMKSGSLRFQRWYRFGCSIICLYVSE